PPLSHSLKSLLGNIFFLTNSFVHTWGSNDPLWSLMYEWWFYMLYPLYWPLLRRSLFGATGVVVALYAVSFLPLAATFGHAGLLFQNVFRGMLIWWLGVLLAEVHSGRLDRGFGRIAPLAALVPILGLLQIAHKPVPDIFYGLGCAGIIALGFWWQQIGRSVGLLERLKRLGDMSYTLYVIHFPIFVFVGGWLMSTSPTGELPRTIGWALLGIAGILPLAYAGHYLVEKPFVGRHRPDQRRAQTARAAFTR
ncbi:MAG TPA: acyltransferase, partial [Tepidisphaeraceae bacterium]|nr:acyltransferase [Tepidisphaeraceae bacterium]